MAPQRRTGRLWSWSIVIALSSLIATDGLSQVPARPQVERPRSAEALVATLARLAASARLDEPEYVATTLGVTWRGTMSELVTRAEPCVHRLDDRSRVQGLFTPTQRDWLKPAQASRATGREASQRPETLYQWARTVHCPASISLAQSVEARVSISGLPGFACITKEDVKRWLPNAVDLFGTDGLSLVNVGDDVAGSKMSFTYYGGDRCAESVSVEQSPTLTGRYATAFDQRSDCIAAAEQAYCAAPPPGDTAGAKMTALDDMADRACEPLQAYYDRLPAHLRFEPRVAMVAEIKPEDSPCVQVAKNAAAETERRRRADSPYRRF